MVASAISQQLRRVGGISTPHQRLYARTLMQQLDLDVLHMSKLHRPFFDAAKIEQPHPNARLDGVLCALSKGQAAALIDALLAEVPCET